MTSLEIMCQRLPTVIPGSKVEYITAPTSYKAVNQRILEILAILMIKSKRQEEILSYFTILKKIIENFNKNAVMKRFENGMLNVMAVMFVYIFVEFLNQTCWPKASVRLVS